MAEPPADPTPDESAGRRVAVTGASGLIGSALADALRDEGTEVRPVVRGSPRAGEIGWDPAADRIDADGFSGLDAVVHLAGETVGERWNREKKARIRRSRVHGTALLARTLAALPERPAVLVSASAIGYYGDRGDERLDESSAPGTDFLAGVAREWEAATRPAEEAGIRVVHVRFGVVLSPDGGALARMLPVFRMAVGGTLGDGGQWMSWVALPDVVAAIRFAIGTPALRGPVNVSAPEPATNAEFTRTLAQVLDRPALLQVPETILRLRFGEMADATLLASQRALPERLLEAGFRFRYPGLEEALRAVLRDA